ncbi:MAG: PEGA domain-containing protein [Sandaracinaceae bacterium]|nr:PEGA domain-containing protein [Sandaracinaceae bacterium]
MAVFATAFSHPKRTDTMRAMGRRGYAHHRSCTGAGAFVRSIALVLAGVAAASGPHPARADRAAEARFHDELGRQHYAARRYEAALREFFAQHRLAPSGRILFNIALCFERLRRSDQAFLFFAEYLATSDDDDLDRRGFAEEAVRRIEPTLALVEVTSDPPGATIHIDRREAGSYGTTPRLLPVPAGARRIELVLEGHAPAFVQVEGRVGERVAATSRLERILGRVELTAPEGSTAQIRDATGAVAHEAPAPLSVELPPGDYTIEVFASGHEPWRGLARVTPNESTPVVAQPVGLPPPTGELTVTSSTAGALVDIDGEAAGFAPAVLGALSVGTHRIRVGHPGLVPWEGDVEITATERAWLTVTLEPPPRTDRSPATWVFGGVGAAALLGGAVTGAFAIDAHSQFTARPSATTRDTGETLAIATDVLLVTGVVSFAVAVILWFATEHVDERSSRATVSTVER